MITVSGQKGSDRYGVAGAIVNVVLAQKPGPDAKLDATSLTTDASGAATVKLTLSQTRGRHVVDATSGSLSAEYVADTLAGANLVSRARHGGEINTTPVAPRNNPAVFFVLAGAVVVLGYHWPYASRRLRPRRTGQPAARAAAD